MSLDPEFFFFLFPPQNHPGFVSHENITSFGLPGIGGGFAGQVAHQPGGGRVEAAGSWQPNDERPGPRS